VGLPTDTVLPYDAELPPDKIVRRAKPPRPPQPWENPFGFKHKVSSPFALFLGACCLAAGLGLWWYLTNGEAHERILSYTALPSPAETFNEEQVTTLWTSSALAANLWASLRRVILGFTLAATVGVPLGVVCGCYPWFNAFMAPVNVFGRNIPIAALIPLTFALFGIGESQKVMFIFIATVAFVMMDTANAINSISARYIDTGLTLGASRPQIVRGVLVPLAMPHIFNSLRSLFGLAFGYIMLAELVTIGGTGGLGNVINIAQKRGHRETILLVLMIIPAVALVIDRTWFAVQKSMFPYEYGGRGVLHSCWRGIVHVLEDTKQAIIRPKQLDQSQLAIIAARRQHVVSHP
jgi:ABC-type nitrate/sulfonate/bicarbonate transport system permease component